MTKSTTLKVTGPLALGFAILSAITAVMGYYQLTLIAICLSFVPFLIYVLIRNIDLANNLVALNELNDEVFEFIESDRVGVERFSIPEGLSYSDVQPVFEGLVGDLGITSVAISSYEVEVVKEKTNEETT